MLFALGNSLVSITATYIILKAVLGGFGKLLLPAQCAGVLLC